MSDETVKMGLDAWRDAERVRDGFALGSSAWDEAEAEVRQAAKVFHARLANATARYVEIEPSDWSPGGALVRRTCGLSVFSAGQSLAGSPRR